MEGLRSDILNPALWGRPVSTWVVNLEVRTELQCRSLNTLQIIVANDDNYALAA